MPDLKLVLLDSSATCVESLRQRYAKDALIQCLCEDATKFPSLTNNSIDLILDKGFLDALLCSEGWNGPVARAMEAASRVLTTGRGRYVWIGYKLPMSTLEFVTEAAPELVWEHDVAGSTDQVSIRIATND